MERKVSVTFLSRSLRMRKRDRADAVLPEQETGVPSHRYRFFCAFGRF